MQRPSLRLASLGLAASLAGCTHLGTNISGNFTCRVPAGDCQPVSVIDARATRDIIAASGGSELDQRPPVPAEADDPARTGERTLRVVLPAHVDSSGILHDEAVAWVVVEAPRWAGELRDPQSTDPESDMRALRRSLRDAAHRAPAPGLSTSYPEPAAPLSPEDSALPAHSPFSPATPLVLPSRSGVVETGAPAPASGRSGLVPTPEDRTSRHVPHDLVFPSAAAINAAKAKEQGPVANPPKVPASDKDPN